MLTRRVAGWIMVANGSECRIFTRNFKTGNLDVVREFISEEGRALTRDIGTDKPGRSFETVGRMRHAMTPRTLFQQQIKQDFARQITDFLNEAAIKDHFHALTIAASSPFLGYLRALLNEHVQEKIVIQINKDLTRVPPQDLLSYLYQKAG